MYSRRGLERHTEEGKGPVDEIRIDIDDTRVVPDT